MSQKCRIVACQISFYKKYKNKNLEKENHVTQNAEFVNDKFPFIKIRKFLLYKSQHFRSGYKVHKKGISHVKTLATLPSCTHFTRSTRCVAYL